MSLIFNENSINKWYYNTSDLIKVYYHDAVCYYKLTPGGTQTPCFAVVADISQYTDREFEDVFNQADGKWYKLNNLNAYEEYGVYDSTTATTHYEGKLTVDNGYEYQYSGSSWVNVGEVSGGTASLPNVSFVLNYNAKNYDATNSLIPQTNGQTKEVDATCNYNPSNIIDHSADGYISVTGNTRLTVSGGTTSLGRNNTQTGCTMTIVSKALTKKNYSLLTCRGGSGVSTLCWMYRQYTDNVRLHGKTDSPTLSCSTSEPSVLSVKTYYDNEVKSTMKNWGDNTTSGGSYQYYNNYSNGALFCDYLTYNSEFWQGDFYWIYLSHEVLTDEQIQQVIAYNESGGGEIEYPLYYDEMQDPPDNVSFSSMTEAEEYECPWVGMIAIIDGVKYIFSGDSQSGYEWVAKPSRLPQGYTEVEYVENTGDSTVNLGIQLMKNVNDSFEVVFDNVMTYTSGGETLQTFITCAREISPYEGWYERFNNNGNVMIAGNVGTATLSSGRTIVSGDVYHTSIGVNSIPSNVTHDYPLNLFSSLDSTKTPWRFCKGKLYNMQVTYNNTLVRDLVPCKNSSNIAGLYDLENDVFYSSASGYDQLVAGPTV